MSGSVKLIVYAPEARAEEAASVALMVKRDHPANPLVAVGRGGHFYSVAQHQTGTVTVRWQSDGESPF